MHAFSLQAGVSDRHREDRPAVAPSLACRVQRAKSPVIGFNTDNRTTTGVVYGAVELTGANLYGSRRAEWIGNAASRSADIGSVNDDRIAVALTEDTVIQAGSTRAGGRYIGHRH